MLPFQVQKGTTVAKRKSRAKGIWRFARLKTACLIPSGTIVSTILWTQSSSMLVTSEYSTPKTKMHTETQASKRGTGI